MKRAAIYVRISTDHQETARQKEELKAYAKAMGYAVTKLYEDTETGFSDTRKEFLKLRTLTRADIDAVIVWELSRIGRKTSAVIRMIEEWADAGICFIAKKENLVSLGEDGKINPNTKLFLSVMATIAEMEADTIKQRMVSGKIHKMRNGASPYTNRVPLGYRKVDGRLVIDEEDAEKVRDAFRLRIEGYSQKRICDITGLRPSTVDYILHNEVYKGVGRNKALPGEMFEVPKIVDEATWARVQERRACVVKHNGKDCWHPLKLKVVCPVCGRHWCYISPWHGRPGRFTCSMGSGRSDGIPHPRYSAGANAENLGAAVQPAVEKWRRTRKAVPVVTESPKSIKQYLESLERESERKKRALELAEKKYAAIADLLTVTEKKEELRQIVKARESLQNAEIEIFEARKRYDNALVLSTAVWTGTSDQPWQELDKEVRVTSWGRDLRTYDVETVTGDVIPVTVDTRKPRIA